MRWGDGSQVRLCTGPRKALGHGQQQGVGEEGRNKQKMEGSIPSPSQVGKLRRESR